MTDYNEQEPRMYTEQEVFQLFQHFRAEEQKLNEKSREEGPLPLDITGYLEESTPLQIQEKFKRFKRDLTKYQDEEWATGEEINKSLLPKLKAYTVDTAQVVALIYKSSDIIRTQGRAATELYEQLATLQNDGEMPQEQARQLLATTVENAKRLAIFTWYQAKQQDEEAKGYAIKALKLPASLKHLENKPSGKKDAFSLEFLEQYNEATYQQRVLQAATGGNNNRGGYSNQWNSSRGGRGRGRGKNFYGGRGHGNSTSDNQYKPHNNQS
ncbi:hypothetical protein G6F17_008215 [Rhizopus arrhizus]|nr:hypothetical protein G6F17_008215 [Rhizopus arrhizus]KAG1125704.1 hypothetical protein G6F42_008473 [Rhizopus arrhizus]